MFRKDIINLATIKEKPLPLHIAIIMDGNGRWAKKRGLPRAAGHRAGMEAFKKTIISCIEVGIKYLTVYAFSTENWKRPQEEVNFLMSLLVEYIEKELNELDKNGVRVHTIGNLTDLPSLAQQQINKAVKKTAGNNKLYLQIALNYGGRAEILQAVRQIGEDIESGKMTVGNINEQVFARYLYTNGIPDPDLLIRTSGELRISNFLLWQLAYTEFCSPDVLWPDFTAQHLYKAIYEYQNRDRRYGGLKQ